MNQDKAEQSIIKEQSFRCEELDLTGLYGWRILPVLGKNIYKFPILRRLILSETRYIAAALLQHIPE